ncbi:MAG: dTDP-glucose 4,6-dehydratase [Candidatus Portnoybacteria bacterium]|nr:dTDP-glucose 4,6-dehydratase [Candidatus Portnoybacteria bacterium]MDD4982471.1 dTDP-glucose 4,6-dehydratase [Candidatus Portnoybacteria bacterium]
MKKTVLITGGAGFIGSNFTGYLFKKYPDYRIIVLDCLTYAGGIDNFDPEMLRNKERFELVYGNICNNDLVDELVSNADIVVHFAAETHVTRSIYDNLIFFQTDTLGTQSVANAVSKHKKRIEKFIHISTSEVYGTANSDTMKEDEHPLLPMSPYAAAKAGADRLVYSYWATYDIPVVIVRPFNNYGSRQHLEKVIPRFITNCLLNEPITVHGDGSAQRDWVNVEDTCQAIDKIMSGDIEKLKGQVINIGTGKSISIKTIAEIIVEKMERPKSLITYTDDRPGQVFRHTADIEKARKLLGWQPKISFESGLEKTIDWYRNNQEWWETRLWMRKIPIINKDGKKIIH